MSRFLGGFMKTYDENGKLIIIYEQNCKKCGKYFLATSPNKKFCSDECKKIVPKSKICKKCGQIVDRDGYLCSNCAPRKHEPLKIIICVGCGKEFKHSVGFTKPSKNHSIKCPNCSLILGQIKENELLKQNKLEEKRRIESAKPIKQATFQTCSICGSIFFSERKLKYCSKRCRTASQWKTAELYRYKVPLDKLYERDRGICHICGKKCDWNDKYTNENGFIVYGAYYPSRDHVIPKSKGGSHTWDNIKLAHIKCNSEKGAKYDTEEKRRIKEEVC